MAKAAIMGFGTVGSGVAEALEKNKQSIARKAGEELSLGYILDVRSPAPPYDTLWTESIEDILADDEVKVVAECIGGTKFAYPLVKRVLESGRSVATSNKELVAEYGYELIELAKSRGVCFLFEASVGGGMPIIAPLYRSLAANTIRSITGILNGTTNFILTKMAREGVGYPEALAEAQSMGYAETIDPSYDIDGVDAGRKIAILASLAYGEHIKPSRFTTQGIRGVTARDIEFLGGCGAVVKLIARAAKREEGLEIWVAPCAVKRENQLSSVNDVYNGVLVEGDILGEVMFYGRGAGKLPTASAVVADMIDSITAGVSVHSALCWGEENFGETVGELSEKYAYYIRRGNECLFTERLSPSEVERLGADIKMRVLE